MLGDAGPGVADLVDVDVDVPEAVVMIGGVFVVDANLEGEAGGGHVGDDPVAVPDGIGGAADGRGAEAHVRILPVPRGQVGVELREEIRVGREGVDVRHRQAAGAVEGKFEREARRRRRDGRLIVAARRCLLFGSGRFSAVRDFLLQMSRLVDELGGYRI